MDKERLLNFAGTMRRKLSTGCAVLALVLAVAVGCDDGPRLGQVCGRVTLDGAPLEEATVMFLPLAGGRPAIGMTDSDGRYELLFVGNTRGAVIGRHEVKIYTASPEATGYDEHDNVVVVSPERPERVPLRYHKRTELVAEVRPGPANYDFDLKSDMPDEPEREQISSGPISDE